MRSGGGGVAIGRGPSTTSTSPPTGSSELESQHVDRVGLTQAEVDLVRREQPPRLHPVPLRLLEVGPAEGDQLVALKPADHSRARPVRPPQPEAELTHEREPLRVTELRPIAQLVFDHPSPERDAAQDGWAPRAPEDLDVVGAVQPARAVNVGCAVEARVLARGLRGLPRSPRAGAPRDRAEQELRPVAVPRECPGAPRNDRLRRGANGELASEGDVGAHEPGGSAGIASGMGATGAVTGAGSGM